MKRLSITKISIKFIKDVTEGTLERKELIEEIIEKSLKKRYKFKENR